MREARAGLAKLTRPRLVAAVPRERLFQCLDHRLAHPTVWVSGPPGAGKTTLLAGYAESRKRPTLWYQLDDGDGDVATFFHYLGVAAKGLAVGKRAQPLPALTPEYLPGLLGFSRRFFRALFARLPPHALLVIEDYQEVPPNSRLHAVLACALAELPEGVGCIVASRAGPPAEFARLTANQSIVLLGWDQLRLTEDEAAAIARARQITDESLIRASHEHSDGWVAGLILLLGQPAAKSVKTAPVLAPSSKSLFNYFAGIFANALSDETRDVLLSTAFLPSMTGPLAAHLSGNENAGRVLSALHENNYFVHRRVGSDPVYQLHPLFHEYLNDLVNQRCTPSERLRKVRETADTLVEFGDDEGAAVLYGEAGDWRLAAELVLRLAPHLLMQGRWQTLQTRIAAFPPAEVEARPWLQYWVGASLMAVDPEAALRTLTRAYDGFDGADDTLGQMLAAATILEIKFVLWSDFAFDRWIEPLERLLASGVAFPDSDTEIRVLSNLVAALTFRSPWHSLLPMYRQRLLKLALSDAAPGQRLVAAVNLSHHFAWLGDPDNALQAVSVARPLLARDDILPIHKVWALMSLAYVAYARADHDDGDALFSQTFALSEEHGLSYADFWIRAADCWHRLDRGEYKAVASILAKLEARLTGGRGMDVGHFHLIKGWLALLEGNFVLARDELELANTLAVRMGTTYTECYQDLMLAEVMIELREYAKAEEWVARFRATFGAVESPVFEFNARLVDAYLALTRGEYARCTTALNSAFSIGRPNGYVQTFNWYARMMSRLCAFALEHDIEVEYVRMLIKRRGLTPETPIERWPWPVKIQTLGRFEVRTDGEALRFEGKAQHKPIELMKVLVALGGRDIPADKLIDILWRETGVGDGQKAFDITVHRLRKLLGSDDAVQVADRRATLNPKTVWVDVWALERVLAPLIEAVNAPEPDIGLLEAAAPQVLGLYRGHFLAGEPEEAWQIPIRNRLAGRFERFALRLGEYWQSRQQWRHAFELYGRAVELDPLAESFYRRQMVCLQALGERSEAIEVFRRCRHVLSVTLGVAPTAETEAVYRRLLAS